MTIKYLEQIFKTKKPFNPLSRVGGAAGVTLSRPAFAIMIKFSNHYNDFIALVDSVKSLKGQDEKTMIENIKTQKSADSIIKMWESSARMRQWM
jgi:hypothetical protein